MEPTAASRCHARMQRVLGQQPCRQASTPRPERVADRARPACRPIRRGSEVPCWPILGSDPSGCRLEVPGLIARRGSDVGAGEHDDHWAAPGKAHAVRTGVIARLQAVGCLGQPAPHARVVGRCACREQQAHDAGRLAEGKPSTKLCLTANKLRRRASAQQRGPAVRGGSTAKRSVRLALLTAAWAPARLPDGSPPEQGGDYATAVVVQDALRPAAIARSPDASAKRAGRRGSRDPPGLSHSSS